MLSTISQIYTGVSAERMGDWTDRAGIISDSQMGFRKGRIMADNMFIIRIITYKYVGKKIGGVYLLDYRKHLIQWSEKRYGSCAR